MSRLSGTPLWWDLLRFAWRARRQALTLILLASIGVTTAALAVRSAMQQEHRHSLVVLVPGKGAWLPSCMVDSLGTPVLKWYPLGVDTAP